MKRGFVLSFIAVCLITLDLFLNAYSEDIKKEDRFFLNSLHYTTRRENVAIVMVLRL